MLRIIGGDLRGRILEKPPHSVTRPTSDRARESLFNILTHRFKNQAGLSLLKDAYVLDLCAGSGAFGFECLSRGAAFCVFVDNTLSALSTLRKNQKNLGLDFKSLLLKADILTPFSLPQNSFPLPKTGFDLIFLDPPYGKGYVEKALEVCIHQNYLSSHSLFLAELEYNEDITFLHHRFEILDQRRYGRAQFIFGHLK